ncbi:phage head-tail connector protein [Levilactobacillus enshiensis]|uniref:phage head-tail connector protein n=1 Tax=Levilactobacillus enshiensis TaxID=2590213 RepID=UPI001CDC2889|nr:phage head-tail connector protein [Levilactobacillus enshiensis]
MADNTTPEGLLRRLGVTPNTTESQLVDELYDDAVANVLDFTHRDELVGRMAVYAKQLTVVAYNRLDTEGETERVEGNISRYFVTDIPEEIQKPLRRYRLATLRGMS